MQLGLAHIVNGPHWQITRIDRRPSLKDSNDQSAFQDAYFVTVVKSRDGVNGAVAAQRSEDEQKAWLELVSRLANSDNRALEGVVVTLLGAW